jgi:GTPase
VRFELDGKSFMAIDTPGLKRAKSVASDLEFYSSHRAQRSIRRADVVLLFLDPTQRVSKLEKQLSEYVSENYKPCVFVVNKWDLMAGSMPTSKWVSYLHDSFRSMRYVPIAFVTGQTGKNVKALLNHAQMLFKQSLLRATTGELNRVIREALAQNPPPLHENKRPKIYYATQVGTQPPTIVMFCNDPQSLDATYRRYLLGFFRQRLPFTEVPIKLYLRRREHGDRRDEVEPERPEPETTAADRERSP